MTTLAALPFLRPSALDRPTSRPGPMPTPLDDGEARTPKPLRVLDPSDPVAVELGRLYEVLLSTHDAEIQAHRAEYDADCAFDEHPEWDEARCEEHRAERRRLMEASFKAQEPRRDAYWTLTRAVVAAHGGGDPRLSEWYRYGTAHRVVRVGDRVYSVCSDYDAEWPEYEGDHGSVVLSIIDL